MPPPVRALATANVNGVRAATGKGLLDWLAVTDADAVCLQEVRARPEELPAALTDALAAAGWHLRLAPCETAKGRNGVAVLSRSEPEAVRIGFGDPAIDLDGRYLEVDLPGDLTVASLYLPKGVAGTDKQDAKDAFLKTFGDHLCTAFARCAATDREMVVAGDWNIAPTEQDLRNWRNNQRNSGFLPHEREWFAGLLEHGWTDVVRALHPGTDGPYSWWTYRGRAFDNDVGWRIDHLLTTPGLAAAAHEAVVERAPSHDTRWSDHAPVVVRLGAGAPAGGTE
ncbi:Exodeoxyribonuclease III [Pseudonocardia sp. Ae168_Ps1]|uniref:exodeoxyribonuclease III n=1 Tax=unclassified Pseudonocardia TaxID=2619320 RepID=UPI00094B1A01|nr:MULTISPECIES: exodeoxyribonuclease III [unclassified Pseudonocardia]OLL74034.1 Exodeoxyribonuclease III [Pseudonocardia sp. Ae150A_Ps1]OLL80011.1 Exodeoxyribonuclease III [Pseudonocardia sp. Ae168_Ps1]OLL85856.1 Exodeoxyribonuclease III [Pseudonocardia sp. Ae263_Ps1]OLL94113.1 Exodeoxyribonuclease III [Pseudonocardia sp. Ae356_Ps1]